MNDLTPETICAGLAGALIVARAGMELWLDRLNCRHVRRHASAVPDAFKETMSEATYAKSVEYTLAKGRLSQVEGVYDTAVLLLVLFSGVLPWTYGWLSQWLGESAWMQVVFLLSVGIGMSIPGVPFEWYGQFRLEERFGFNTMTLRTWFLDHVKGLLLLLVLGLPLLWLILKIVQWTGGWWWLWAWGTVIGFQLLMVLLAPVLILPLFNKFTPLPDGSLRDGLLRLADRTGFRARSIQVMDGSKRSRHSNAFFTGFGKFRRIVLFDTLVEQLEEREMEAVLAHEIGHYKKKHILKMLIFSAASLLAMLFALSWLMGQTWFYGAFGFEPGSAAPAFLLFGLLAGMIAFWFSPVTAFWSRRHEYQADEFAARAMREVNSLIGALRKLSEKNLSNLTPHPIYSAFYYSHPTLVERERSLKAVQTDTTFPRAAPPR